MNNKLALTLTLFPGEREQQSEDLMDTLPAMAASLHSTARRTILPLPRERAGVRGFAGLPFILVALLMFTSFVRAQPYSIDWHTIDGGGGTSTGGVFSVSSTIG